MSPQFLPPPTTGDSAGWQQTVISFLAEKERRSGSKRTVEGYSRVLWLFLGGFRSPSEVERDARRGLHPPVATVYLIQ